MQDENLNAINYDARIVKTVRNLQKDSVILKNSNLEANENEIDSQVKMLNAEPNSELNYAASDNSHEEEKNSTKLRKFLENDR